MKNTLLCPAEKESEQADGADRPATNLKGTKGAPVVAGLADGYLSAFSG